MRLRFKRFRKKQLLITLVLLQIIFFIGIIFWNPNSDFTNEISNEIIRNPSNLKKKYILKNNNRSCEPINKSYINYNVFIDGINYPTHVLLHLDKSIDFECLSQNSKVKKIFYLDNWWGNRYGIGYRKPFLEINCPITNCEIIDDRKRLNEADYIIVYGGDEKISSELNTIKQKTNPSQKWIYLWYESYHYKNNNPYEDEMLFNHINMATHYRIGSDFDGFYESSSGMYWMFNENYDVNINHLKSKTQFAAALISNCVMTTSKRLEYISELKKYIDVKVFGKCGESCDKIDANNCLETICNQFMFYFSFENSICEDYVTEKLFKVLRYPIIPVVLGGANYSYYLPKSAYINVLDYATPEDLSNYLIYLSKNEIAYNSYFKWKQHVKFNDKAVELSPICDMCINLHLEDYYYVLDGRKSKNIEKKEILNHKCKFPLPTLFRFFNLAPFTKFYKFLDSWNKYIFGI